MCNNPDAADEVLDSLQGYANQTTQFRVIRMHGQQRHAQLFTSEKWRVACAALQEFNQRLGQAESGDLFE